MDEFTLQTNTKELREAPLGVIQLFVDRRVADVIFGHDHIRDAQLEIKELEDRISDMQRHVQYRRDDIEDNNLEVAYGINELDNRDWCIDEYCDVYTDDRERFGLE